MKEKKPKLLLSIDLDEFYHIRWITGSKGALYSDPKAFFRTIYQTEHPQGAILEATRKLLVSFREFGVQCTFFVTGEVAEYYPDLVRDISAGGHEIACHSFRHVDLTYHTQESFVEELKKAKSLLEDLIQEPVKGFRMPNLIIKNWVLPVLKNLGFEYDSSICPARSFLGKFGDYFRCPVFPYQPQADSFFPLKKTPGGSASKNPETGFWELPIPVFPGLKIPGATGNVTRAFGTWWSNLTHRSVQMKGGLPHYYFHPWELGVIPENFQVQTWFQKLFLRRMGNWMMGYVEYLLKNFECISCRQFVHKANEK